MSSSPVSALSDIGKNLGFANFVGENSVVADFARVSTLSESRSVRLFGFVKKLCFCFAEALRKVG